MKNSVKLLNNVVLKYYKSIVILSILSITNFQLLADCGVTDPDLIISSSMTLPGGFYNQNIEITGANTVVTIDNSNVLMGDGMKIFVHATCTLEVINNSVLDSRCPVMWWGVELEETDPSSGINGGCFIGYKSQIINAQYGINAHAGFLIDIQYCLFDRNTIDIMINDGPTLADYAYGYYFYCVGTRFDCSSIPLKAPFPGINPAYSSSSSFAAISGSNTDLSIGDVISYQKNYFNNKDNGIYLIHATQEIINAEFNSISKYGIYEAGPINNFNSYVGRFASGSAVPVTFNNCNIGILFRRMGGNIFGNTFNNVNDGIRIMEGSTGNNLLVNNNFLFPNYTGIVVDYFFSIPGQYPVSLKIDNNRVTFNNPLTPLGSGFGIWAKEFYHATTNLQISNNRINENIAGVYGVTAQNVTGSSIFNNKVFIYHNRPYTLGFVLQSCNLTSLSCNEVYSSAIQPIPPPTTLQSSYFISLSPNSNIECNTSHDTYYGFRFLGSSPGTIFSTSEIYNHTYGLSLGSSAIIGPQYNTGNGWAGIYAGGFGADDAGGLAQALLSPFYVDPFIAPYVPSLPPPLAGWFSYLNLPMTYCPASCVHHFQSPDDKGLDKIIATGAIPSLNSFDEGTKWMSEKYLYEKLSIDSTLRDSVLEFQNFFNNKSSEPLGLFSSVENGVSSLSLNAQLLSNQINSKNILLNNDFTLIHNNNSILYDSLTTDSAKLLLLTQKKYNYGNIKNLLGDITALVTSIEQEKNIQLNNINSANALIVTSDEIQEDQKIVNNIYLATIARGNFNFTLSQIIELQEISNHCPLISGYSVYEARGMYSLVDENIIYNDDAICLQQGVLARKRNNSNHTIIIQSAYPSPANDQLTIDYFINQRGKLRIFNEIGENVYNQNLNPSQHSIVVNVHDLKQGIYNYSITDETGDPIIGKFVKLN